MKKLLIGLTMLGAVSSFANVGLDKKILDVIEVDYNTTCEYLEATKPCLINYKCTNTITYECKDSEGSKRIGVKVVRHAQHVDQIFEIRGIKEILTYQIQDEQEQQNQQAEQVRQVQPIQEQQNQNPNMNQRNVVETDGQVAPIQTQQNQNPNQDSEKQFQKKQDQRQYPARSE